MSKTMRCRPLACVRRVACPWLATSQSPTGSWTSRRRSGRSPMRAFPPGHSRLPPKASFAHPGIRRPERPPRLLGGAWAAGPRRVPHRGDPHDWRDLRAAEIGCDVGTAEVGHGRSPGARLDSAAGSASPTGRLQDPATGPAAAVRGSGVQVSPGAPRRVRAKARERGPIGAVLRANRSPRRSDPTRPMDGGDRCRGVPREARRPRVLRCGFERTARIAAASPDGLRHHRALRRVCRPTGVRVSEAGAPGPSETLVASPLPVEFSAGPAQAWVPGPTTRGDPTPPRRRERTEDASS
jgi:hypothetical protein